MNILRWFLILPISILSSIFFPYLYQQIVELFISKNSFAGSFIIDGASFFLQGLFFMVPVYLIAPKFKNIVLIVFLILWIFTVIFGNYYLYNINRDYVGFWNSFLRVLGALLAFINIKLSNKL